VTVNETGVQTVTCELRGPIALLGLNRPEKHNALNDAMIEGLARFFGAPPPEARVVVLHSTGESFCSGLDLSEHRERSAIAVTRHSQTWHRAFDAVQFGGLPVVSALTGAVIGGGLELAVATHVRVAEPTAFYALPEGQRGIFVGGGGSVRVARVIGSSRMTEMMLTGRRYAADDGQRLGLSHYLVGRGEALEKALELATAIASNAPLSNYAIVTALARIEDMSMTEGLFAESLMAGLVQSGEDAARRMGEFLDRKGRG
jgi:(methylthio)acryloyl-CoA hydratase